MRVAVLIALVAIVSGFSRTDPAGPKGPALRVVSGTYEAGPKGPALQGGFEDALAVAKDLPRLHSLLVSRRGELVLERYYNGARAARPANIKSASKSIISALVGVAIDRRLIAGVDTPIATYFPELKKDRDPAKQRITIEDLLTMRSGLESTSNRNYGAWVQSRNWVQHALNRPLLAEPGTQMDYSTGNTHLLSAILTRAVGSSTWQFANDTIGRPLGFAIPRWPQDPQGIYFGGNDMLLTPRQMLAFGQLYLDRGRVRLRADSSAQQVSERQVVPASWIERSFVARGRSYWSDQEYGYGWWIRELGGHRAYYAWGFGGQYIFVVPDLELVVVTTSSSTVAEDRRSHRRNVFDLVEYLVVERVSSSN
jgi:CubicO group peptidase (beta-lactamase class C family)